MGMFTMNKGERVGAAVMLALIVIAIAATIFFSRKGSSGEADDAAMRNAKATIELREATDKAELDTAATRHGGRKAKAHSKKKKKSKKAKEVHRNPMAPVNPY